jgi:uncharacterized protein YbjT (DUF2867 family)
MNMEKEKRILVAGASGYIGGRLMEKLLSAGHRVRGMSRNVEGLQAKWGDRIEAVEANVLDASSLETAFADVDVAYYLIHSMESGKDFAELERQSAWNFARAAEEASVTRILYLGGLADESEGLSPHMSSRIETGRILRESKVPTLEFRASIVLGAGSLSFEMIRALEQRLPIMITPKWVRVKAQPIAVEDLLAYLIGGLELPDDQVGVYEIGGADVVSYKEIMQAYAEERGLKRIYLPVPVLSPKISSLWLGLVTPLLARVGRKLIESVTHPSVVKHPKALDVFEVKPKGVKAAMEEALAEEEAGYAITRWSDALSAGNTHRTWAGVRFGSRLLDTREVTSDARPEDVFDSVMRIGGETGWYYATFLWKIRGYIDEWVGGVGMRRGRRHPDELIPGDVLDCWRVERVDPGQLLRLRAEMKLPGRAWLEFEVTPEEGGGCTLRQTASFDPKGLSGLSYWYGIYGLHELVFRGMAKGVVAAAERSPGSPLPG